MAVDIIAVQSGGILASAVTLIMGFLVLTFPSFLRVLIGVYLVFIGTLGLLASLL
ncbi:MAG: DUF3096 domain-containing protein [Candidatus Woesearchaeota archaeon]